MNYAITHPDARAGRDSLLALWGRNLPHATAQRYAWLYEDGPAVSLLATTEKSLDIGAAGLMRREFLVTADKAGGRIVTGGQAVDLNVDREHRTMGLALQLQRALLETAERDLAFVYALPGRQANPILRRVGYRELGPLENWTKPLSAEYKLRRFLKSGWPARMAAWFIDPWLRWRFGERRRAGAADALTLATFDDRFDELFAAAAAQFPLIGLRGAAYLAWRFSRYPGGGYHIFGCGDSRRLSSYLVFRSESTGVFRISDFLFRDGDALDGLLAAFIRHARSHGAQALQVTFAGPPWVAARLQAFGFRPRVSHDVVLVYPGPQSSGLPDLTRRENWFITRADMDVEA